MSSILLSAGMLFLRVWLIVLPLGIGLALQTANAVPVTHGLIFEEHETSPNPGTLYTGSFAIDDAWLLPNAFIPFSLFDSFSILIGRLVLDLANAYSPTLEGVLTDASGIVYVFEDIAPLTHPTSGGDHECSLESVRRHLHRGP